MDQTSQSPDTLRMTAEREAEQAAATLRGKEAAARRQAEARAAHSAEVAKRNSDDAAMGIPANWTEPRKAAARKAYADRQRAAQVEAERAANPQKPTPRSALSRDSSPHSVFLKLQGGTQRPGLAFGIG